MSPPPGEGGTTDYAELEVSCPHRPHSHPRPRSALSFRPVLNQARTGLSPRLSSCPLTPPDPRLLLFHPPPPAFVHMHIFLSLPALVRIRRHDDQRVGRSRGSHGPSSCRQEYLARPVLRRQPSSRTGRGDGHPFAFIFSPEPSPCLLRLRSFSMLFR